MKLPVQMGVKAKCLFASLTLLTHPVAYSSPSGTKHSQVQSPYKAPVEVKTEKKRRYTDLFGFNSNGIISALNGAWMAVASVNWYRYSSYQAQKSFN